MRILVLVKQVCEPESLFELREGQVGLKPPLRYRMNSYDAYALEAALALAEKKEGEVIALTVGGASARAVLERAVGMGASRGVHLLLEDRAMPRPANLARLIADWAKDKGFDLILAGVMSEDALQGAVGPMTARFLNLPLAGSVVRLERDPRTGMLRAEREMEGGRGQMVELAPPALVTVQSGPMAPRYPSLSNLMRAKQNPPQEIPVSADDSGPVREIFKNAEQPQKKRAGLILEGNTLEKAAALRDILSQRGLW